MRTVADVCASGRFVSRYTFATILIVSVLVLAPTPSAIAPGLRVLIAATPAAVFAGVWCVVGLAERAIRRAGVRAAIVVTALASSALFRPALQDAVSLAFGAPVPPAGDALLRAATNVAVWALALGGTALLVDAARTTRETNTTLRSVLARLRTSGDRARGFSEDGRAAVMRATAAIRMPIDATAENARARAESLREDSHDLAARADAVVAVGAPRADDEADARPTQSTFRLPPVGTLTAVYVVAVLPYALRTVDTDTLLRGVGVTLVLGLTAELAPRVRRWRRSTRRSLLAFAVSTSATGALLCVVAALQSIPWPTAVVPGIAFPALAAAMARWRGGAHALTVERTRLSSAISACARADDRDTRGPRAGLRAAAEIVHRDAQSVLVHFALRHPAPSSTEKAELAAALERVACAVAQAFDAPGPRSDALALEALVATWAHAMPVDARVDRDARRALDADPTLAHDTVDIVAEGLLNAAKHARRREAIVTVEVYATGGGPRLRVGVRSPGPPASGAVLRPGSFLDLRRARLVAEPDTTLLTTDLPLGPRFVVSTEHRAGVVIDPT